LTTTRVPTKWKQQSWYKGHIQLLELFKISDYVLLLTLFVMSWLSKSNWFLICWWWTHHQQITNHSAHTKIHPNPTMHGNLFISTIENPRWPPFFNKNQNKTVITQLHLVDLSLWACSLESHWGGGTTIYGPYRYVPLWRVWFSSSLL